MLSSVTTRSVCGEGRGTGRRCSSRLALLQVGLEHIEFAEVGEQWAPGVHDVHGVAAAKGAERASPRGAASPVAIIIRPRGSNKLSCLHFRIARGAFRMSDGLLVLRDRFLGLGHSTKLAHFQDVRAIFAP